jgi:phosphohistidine phosphatase
MRLMLLRHAKSEKADAGEPDRERHLNGRGRGDAPVIGAYMAHHALIPDLALVSPAVRTRETWERIVAELPNRPRETFEERLYNAGRQGVLAVIKETAASVRTLMAVGHNPGLHDLARQLIASGDVEARERLNEGLPTSGLVVIDFAGNDWRKLHARSGRLMHIITPRSLAAASRV